MRSTPNRYTNLESRATTGVDRPSGVFVSGTRHNEILLTPAAFTGTVKCQGAFGETPPDFSAASSASNPWFYVNIKDTSDDSTDTEVAFTTASDVRSFAINKDLLDWVNLEVTARSAGSVSGEIISTNDV